jgi:hypothetical protein
MDSLEAAGPVCFFLRPRKLAREVMLCSVGEELRAKYLLTGGSGFAGDQ